MQRLKDRVAVVTGASRNLGRGIALALGKEGATVYVTGRSVRGEQTKDLPGANIEDTAEQITASGGTGIPVRCDHSVDEQVQALFDRVKQEQGHLDILVNNAWGGYETITDWESWGAPFWKMEKTGRVLRTRELGPEYGFTDVDGRQPPLDDHT